ncbi:unnamed protein product, partial [marine sediment metagenome]
LDDYLGKEIGPQQEGQFHQHILANSIHRLGYRVVNNPIGVPDIEAWLESATEAPAISIRSRIQGWDPQTDPLATVREQLLRLTDEELDEVERIADD